MMLFLSLSVCWSFKFFTTVKPSSLHNSTSFWLMRSVRCDNINIPTSSYTSAHSWLSIVTSKQDLDFLGTEVWKKKSKSCFDVTMGSYDGTEVGKLVGVFLLSHLTKLINQNDVGLYRDHGLIVVKNLNCQEKISR